MGGRLGQDGDRKTSNADGMQNDGSIVQKTKNVNTERIHNAVRDQQRGVYANGFGRGRCVRRPDCGGDGDEISQSKGNPGRDRYLAQQVEPEDVRFLCAGIERCYVPARDPRRKRLLSLWGENRSPEIGPPARGHSRNDLGHAKADNQCYQESQPAFEPAFSMKRGGHTEKADHNPAN